MRRFVPPKTPHFPLYFRLNLKNKGPVFKYIVQNVKVFPVPFKSAGNNAIMI